MHSVPDLLLRLGFAVFGLALVRDRYAGLRGRELWLQGRGFNWVFLRGRTGRFAGAFFIFFGFLLRRNIFFFFGRLFRLRLFLKFRFQITHA